MNAYHIAGGEPISLWGEREASYASWFVSFNGSLPLALPVSTEDISQPGELGRAAFSEVWSCPCGDSSYMQTLRKRGLCLSRPARVSSPGPGRPRNRVWSEAGCEHLIFKFGWC